MKMIFLSCCCAGLLLLPAAGGRAQRRPTNTPAPPSTGAPAEPLPLNHGGKIETKYDGVAHETVIALKRMSVTCEAVRGLQSTLKGVCVAFTASLHCPGKQLDYVRRATLQLIFETKNWDGRHALNERQLTVVADGETIKLGQMELARQGVGESWFAEDSKEVLQISIPFAAFEKISRARVVEVSVGKTAFELRDKNVAALRDLNNRVQITRRSAGDARPSGSGN